ncbi:hypothetical protein [Dysgonomonas sp. 520]|uniref:DUF6913 domain-containing protein n=1 Tax=Dysgonomonas sp. 520 TaxID=2302931 RepID=UPI0013D866F6|nr:hypothetical protein [Dysgonomonas sp. 520]NDW09211.1 hypothetical protein [Dysgonomonas sp. 520]
MGINNYINVNINYFIKRKIAALYKANRRDHEFRSFDEIESVLILFNIEDWLVVEKVINDLKKNGKRVVAWTIKPKIKTDDLPIFPQEVRLVDQTKELSWKQMPKSSVANEFNNQEYDTLIDLTTKKRYYLSYLLMQNNSKLCIGIKDLEQRIYDFIILKEDDKDLFETYEQIKFYLDNMFGSTNNS